MQNYYCIGRYLLRQSLSTRFLLYLISLLVFTPFIANAQHKQLSFKEESIPNILKKIEQETKVVFNYDPTLFKKYPFTGKVSIAEPDKAIEQLLYHTPYTYEKDQSAILIYLPDPTTYTLCGTIKDKQDNTVLPLVNIYLQGRNRGTQSDENGAYNWTFTAYKNQKIIFSYVGYASESRMVQQLNIVGCKDIYLDIDTDLFGGEIIVTDYILDGITEGTSYSSIILDYDLLQSRQSIVEQDILKNVQLLPGISSIDESATNLQIRGSTPDQNLVIWEDVTLYDPGHVFGMISAINPFVVDQVQVFKGVYDPHYDNRVGGIIDLSLTDSIATKFQGGGGTTFSEAHAFFDVPIIPNKLSYLIAGRKTVNELIESPTLTSYTSKVFQNSKIDEQRAGVEEGDLAANQQLNYYDYNGKLIFQPTNNIRFHTSWLRSHNDFNYNAELIEDQVASTDNVFFNASALSSVLEIQYFNKGKTTLSFSNSSYENNYEITLFETDTEDIFENNEVYNNIKDRIFAITNHWQFSPALDIQLGYNRNKKQVSFEALFNTVEEDRVEEEDADFIVADFNHLYTSFNYHKGDFQLNGGLRLTHFTQLNNWASSPRLNAQYAIHPSLKLKAAAGIFQQYISQLKEFGENDLGLNNRIWILNDQEEEQPYIEAKKVSAGFVYHQNGWLLDVEGYYHENTGLSTWNPLFQTSITAADDYSIGSSFSKGLDVLLKKRIEDYTIWLNYSLHETSFLFPEIADFPFPATNDQRHSLNLINNWNLKNWTFSWSYQFKTGLPYSEPSFIEDFEEGGDTDYYIIYEDLNQQRLSNYSRFDIGVNYRPTFPNIPIQAELNFSILNLLNQNNSFSKEFYLADLEDTDGIPEWYDVEKRLLKRTPLVSLRIFW